MLATIEQGSILSDAEIRDICKPLVQHAAQVRHLQKLGMRVGRKANGGPLVARSEFERAMSGTAATLSAAGAATAQPDRKALVMLFNRNKANGSQAQK